MILLVWFDLNTKVSRKDAISLFDFRKIIDTLVAQFVKTYKLVGGVTSWSLTRTKYGKMSASWRGASIYSEHYWGVLEQATKLVKTSVGHRLYCSRPSLWLLSITACPCVCACMFITMCWNWISQMGLIKYKKKEKKREGLVAIENIDWWQNGMNRFSVNLCDVHIL